MTFRLHPSPVDKPQQIAVLGAGMMGQPIIRRLCQAAHTVHVWNRSPEKALAVAADGAVVHDTAADAARQADVLITLLTDGAAVGDVLFQQGVAQAMRPGTVFVDMSSIRPDEASETANRLAECGVAALDAPVSGGTVGAEQGTLAIMVGGDPATFERVRPIFEVLGRPTHVGPHGCGQLAKLANQMIVGITIGAVAEALLMCEKGGADPVRVREAIMGGFAESRILQLHGQRMVERDFTKRGAMTVQLKDMRNAAQTAQALGFDAPITGLFEKLYAEACEHGLGDLDHSALFVELARRNGMT